MLLLSLAALLAEPLAAAPLARPGMMMRPSVMHLRNAHPSAAVMAPRNPLAQRFGRGGAGYAYGTPYFDGAFATSPAPVPVESEAPAVIYAAPAACIRPRIIELRKPPSVKLPKVFYGTPLDCPPSGA